MELQYFGMLILFGLSALLPGIGLVSVWRGRRAEERFYAIVPLLDDGGDEPTWAHLKRMLTAHHAAMSDAHSTRDFLLIGGGLLAGTIASIWAVLDTAL